MTDRIVAVLALSAALTLAATTCVAETYRWVDDQGNVTYSDRPPQQRDVRPPAVEAPTAPEPKTFDVKPLGARPPDATAPEASAPAFKPSDVKPPELQAPEMKASEPRATDAAMKPSKVLDAKATTPSPKTGPTKIDELFELAGVRAQLGGLLGHIAGDLRPPPGQMSQADQATIDRTLAQSLRADAVYAAIRDAFRPLVDRASLETTAAWLRTPVARKIVALEIAASEPSAQPKITEYGATLKANAPPARRLELIQQLDWVTGANETSADLVAVITRGLSTAVSAAGPPERRLRPGQIENRAAQVRARANETLREVRTMAMLYTYQELHDGELVEYVRFSGTDAGRWYNTAMRKAMVSAIGQVVEQTAAELVRAVPLERWARAATPASQAVK